MPTQNFSRQRGAVLIVSLIMLSVMSMFVISMLKTSILELKIGGASHVFQLNFANAEYSINKWINDNTGRMAPNFLALAARGVSGSNCNVNTAGAGQCTDPPSAATGLYGGTVVLTPLQIHCGSLAAFGSQMGGQQFSAVRFDIRAVATGTLGGTTTIHQGIQALAPPGAC